MEPVLVVYRLAAGQYLAVWRDSEWFTIAAVKTRVWEWWPNADITAPSKQYSGWVEAVNALAAYLAERDSI
jgi:hypothetical protein